MTVAFPCSHADKQNRLSVRSLGRYHEGQVLRSIWNRHDLVSDIQFCFHWAIARRLVVLSLPEYVTHCDLIHARFWNRVLGISPHSTELELHT
jgi:hypothetical protein